MIEQQIERLVARYVGDLQEQGPKFLLTDSVNRAVIRELVELGDMATACTCLNMAGVSQSQLNYLVGPTIPGPKPDEDDSFDDYIRKLCLRSRLSQVFQEHEIGIVSKVATIADVFFFLDHEMHLTTPYQRLYTWCAHSIVEESGEFVPPVICKSLARHVAGKPKPHYSDVDQTFETVARTLFEHISRATIDLGLDKTFQGWQPRKTVAKVSTAIAAKTPTIVKPNIQMGQPPSTFTPLRSILPSGAGNTTTLCPGARFKPGDWVEWSASKNTAEALVHQGRCLGIVIADPNWVQFPAASSLAGWHYYIKTLDRFELEEHDFTWIYESQLTPFDPASECCRHTRVHCADGCWVDARRKDLADQVGFERGVLNLTGKAASLPRLPTAQTPVTPQIRMGHAAITPQILMGQTRKAITPQILMGQTRKAITPNIRMGTALPSAEPRKALNPGQ